jgi:hypothetical protein
MGAGQDHYCNSLKIKKDQEKDEILHQHGIKCVRFPFWVQLDSQTALHYFQIRAEVITDFPHGFITTTYYPASFCELGIMRFERELGGLPSPVADAVVSSLRDRANEHGMEYVLPSRLQYLAQ